MDAERVLALLLGWLATFAIHSAVLCATAWILAAGLRRIVRGRAALAVARERLWKLAILGGIATATLSVAGTGTVRLKLELAEEGNGPIALAAPQGPDFSPAIAADPVEATPQIPAAWLPIAAGAWIAGVALGAAAWLRDRRRLSRRLRGAARADSGLAHELLAELRRRAGIRTAPAVWRAPALASPITLGILRPSICIPPRAETDLMRDELEALLAHELAHAQRRDPLLLALCRAVEVVLFFQPLVRFARARLLEQAEILCDERAARWTGDCASLASCLAEVATWVVAGRREELALAMAARGSRLELRVRGLLDEGRESAASRGGLLAAPATLAFALIPLAMPALAFDTARIEPPAPAAADLAASARDLQAVLASLESDYAALASAPGVSAAPERVRARVLAIEERLRSLREMSARLDSLLAEESSQER